MNFAKKKKKKKKDPSKVKAKEPISSGPAVIDLNNVQGHEKYVYTFLLDRIEQIMNEKTKEQDPAEETKEEMPVTRHVSIRTAWINFESIRAKVDRPEQHVLDFFKTELDVEGVISPEGYLILSGKYQNKNITALYKQYLAEFVRCTDCRKLHTKMDRDKNTRLQTLACQDCGATRNLQKIAARFHATKRGERRAAR